MAHSKATQAAIDAAVAQALAAEQLSVWQTIKNVLRSILGQIEKTTKLTDSALNSGINTMQALEVHSHAIKVEADIVASKHLALLEKA